MEFKTLINRYFNGGVKANYLPWEVHLTRKLNVMALVGFLNVGLGIGIFVFFGYYEFIPECILILVIAPLVLLFNIYRNYIWSAYTFYINGWILFTIFGLKMGIDSLVFLLFFPVILSLMQLFTRRELIKHLLINFLICFVFIVVLLIGSKQQWIYIHPSKEMATVLKYISVFFSFTVTFCFLIVLTIESMRQEKVISNVLKEKEILLAEVFHRVKNNMNIVTSLLNLKKNSSDSLEVKDALEECRNRVFSMALVHQNIYNAKNFTSLSIKEYLHDLIDELTISMGSTENIQVFIDCDDINLNVSNAIPCGLIINELVTNSFKYGSNQKNKLRIDIEVKQNGKMIHLRVRDNGPGIDFSNPKKYNSLGLDLVKSLSEQIDGEYHFTNDNGLVFDLEFKITN